MESKKEKSTIKVKRTLPLQQRYEMVQKILDFAFDEYKLSSIILEMVKVIYITQYYTDFKSEIGINEEYSVTKIYDEIMSNERYYKEIISKINPYEIQLINEMIEVEIKAKLSFLQMLIDKLGNFSIEDMKKELASLDLTKLDGINGVLDTIKNKKD